MRNAEQISCGGATQNTGESPVTIRDETRLFSGAEAHSVTKVPMNILHFENIVLVPRLSRESGHFVMYKCAKREMG